MSPLASPPVCFVTGVTREAAVRPVQHRLKDEQSEALAQLLQILCCGEESAVFAFQRLAGRDSLLQESQQQLLRIAREEEGHELLLCGLRAGLPAPPKDLGLQARLRRFFLSLESRDAGIHFARLAALDSAVCKILGELQSARGYVRGQPQISQIFGRIHREEANHVHTALVLGQEFLNRGKFLQEMESTRLRLSALLMQRADAFEGMAVDPDRLAHKLTQLPKLS